MFLKRPQRGPFNDQSYFLLDWSFASRLNGHSNKCFCAKVARHKQDQEETAKLLLQGRESLI